MSRPSRVVLLDEAKDGYEQLNALVGNQIKEGKYSTFEMQLLRSIKQKIGFIKANPFYGDNIPKNIIPKKYGAQNLWRVDLFDFWRMLYTIKGDQVEIICFVLEIVNHDDYNKIFGYRKK